VTELGWLALARGTLDRVSERRRDEEWVARTWADPTTRIFVIEKGEVLVRGERQPELVFVPAGRAPEGDRYLLGLDSGGVAYFAVAGELPTIEGAERAGLRQVGAVLPDRDSGLLTHAVGLENWHSTHGFCPRCGTATEIVAAGHVRACPSDGSEHFPRVDPAVIMLITDPEDRVLLARGPVWPETMRSVLAGFVEPGESLEQAVAREVKEEVGIEIRDIRYVGSQPWPLPQSLMLGFFAHADGGQELIPDPEEIANAAWYSRDDLRAAISSGQIRAPGKLSIASRMISAWFGSEISEL
jgi:NAD+ diphosphatase